MSTSPAGEFFSLQPFPEGVPRSAYITGSVVLYGSVGLVLGGAGGSMLEGIYDSANVNARNDLTSQLNDQTATLNEDTAAYDSLRAVLSADDPSIIRVKAHVTEDKGTIASTQHHLDQVPNHSLEYAGGGAGVGVGFALIACAVKLGIQAVRTRKRAAHTASTL